MLRLHCLAFGIQRPKRAVWRPLRLLLLHSSRALRRYHSFQCELSPASLYGAWICMYRKGTCHQSKWFVGQAICGCSYRDTHQSHLSSFGCQIDFPFLHGYQILNYFLVCSTQTGCLVFSMIMLHALAFLGPRSTWCLLLMGGFVTFCDSQTCYLPPAILMLGRPILHGPAIRWLNAVPVALMTRSACLMGIAIALQSCRTFEAAVQIKLGNQLLAHITVAMVYCCREFLLVANLISNSMNVLLIANYEQSNKCRAQKSSPLVVTASAVARLPRQRLRNAHSQ